MKKTLDIIVDGIIFENQTHGGVSRIYAEILPRICDLDPSVKITILTAGPVVQLLPAHAHIRHIAMPGLQRFIPARWFPNLKKDLRGIVLNNAPVSVNPDTIWHSTNFTLPSQWRGRNICTVYDMNYELFPTFFDHIAGAQFRAYKQKCLQQADAIICISKSTADDLQTMYDIVSEKPVYVTHLACSAGFRKLSEPDAYYHPPTQNAFLLFVGQRQGYKNFDNFLRTYALWQVGKDVDMVVVGSAWISSEEDLLKELGLEQKVHLLTQASDEDLCLLYNLALAFVYPSLYEGFGLPLLEAMSCGCPIVASRISSSIEVARDCPIYFEPAQLNDLLRALDLVKGEGRNSDRVQRGLRLVKEYSWDKTAARTLAAYRSL